MPNKSKHIIINSPVNPLLGKTVVDYLIKEYGLVLSTEKGLNTLKEGVHGVSLGSNEQKTSTYNTYVANLIDFTPTNAENLSGYIFEEACDHFIGNLTEEQLLPCA